MTLTVTSCEPGNCRVEIFNSAGEHIRTLFDVTNQPAGSFEMNWDGKNKYGDEVASGVYIIYMVVDRQAHFTRLLVIR